MTTSTPFILRDWSRTGSGSATRIAASVDGFTLYFEGAGLQHAPDSSDAFLAASLLPAMHQNRPLDLTALPPLTKGLLSQLEVIQEIWSTWNSELHRIPILANENGDEGPAGEGDITFFSGGVNSVHTVLDAGTASGQLIHISGCHFNLEEIPSTAAKQAVAMMADALGCDMQTVFTNWNSYAACYDLAHVLAYGSCLIAVAHLLQPAYARIAAPHSWACLFPWGSHPYLDSRWSTKRVRIGHVGSAATRIEKIAAIAEHPLLLQHLLVCDNNSGSNCGTCDKCKRTLAMLRIIGVDAPSFPRASGDVIAAWLNCGASEANAFYETSCFAKFTENSELLRVLAPGERKALRQRTLTKLPLLSLLFRKEVRGRLYPWGYGPQPDV